MDGGADQARYEAVIEGKLRAPQLPVGVIDRPRLVARLDAETRVALVVAPPGFGKTVLARQWFDTAARPTAWLSLDLFDRSPFTFWRHFLHAVRILRPEVDDEAEAAFIRDPDGDEFLRVLIVQIERSTEVSTIVLDDFARLTSRRVAECLALLVERIGDRLRMVITARCDPMFPLVTWRNARWVTDVREEHLRISDEEAMAISTTFGGVGLMPDTIAALNHHVDGWPIALAMSLEAAREAADPDAQAIALVRSERLLADYLVAEVLDQLPSRHRDVLLSLSVVDWFDDEMGARLAGADVAPVIADLAARRMFLAESGDGPGARRFHRLFRRLLEGELKWRDPTRHADLHRQAAEFCLEKNDLVAAHRHLVAVGDVNAAHDLIMAPAVELARRADHRGLKLLMRSLPQPRRVDAPSLAVDIAIASICANEVETAYEWCDRAEALIVGEAPALHVRVHALRSVAALLDGDLDAASGHISELEHMFRRVRSEDPIGTRIAPTLVRHALVRGQLRDARRWLDRWHGSEHLVDDMSPTGLAFEAWYELAEGRLRRAAERSEHACAQFAHRGHHDPFEMEALVVSAWCRLGAGDLERAGQRAEMARSDAASVGFAWNLVRAGIVWAHVQFFADGPAAALAAVDDVRLGLPHPVSSVLVAPLDLLEARSLIQVGRVGAARRLLDDVEATPGAQLVRAEMALASGLFHDVDLLLADAAEWVLPLRLEAGVLKSSADAARNISTSLTAIVEEGASSGWVSPFLGHGLRVDEVVRRESLERIHPTLARRLGALTAGRSTSPSPPAHMTPRELSILSLLPSHLTYAQIGEELFLSINTVKSNLKSIYRKLDVVTRSEAVDIARGSGLV